MKRSLIWKFGLSFVAVSVAGTLVAAIFVWIATQNAFQNFAFQRSKTDFVSQMVTYYQAHGSWNGVEYYGGSQPQGDFTGPPGGVQFAPFCLADPSGLILLACHDYERQAIVPASVLSGGTAVTVNGARVGTVLSGTPPPLSPSEQLFLSSTERALLFGSLAAIAIALLLGTLLARSLTRPTRELTTALHAMADGQLHQAVPVRSRDEMGELALAFNRMSADLTRANQQRRQMTADIAHDLRTPVTVISGYLEALRDGILPPTAERFTILYDESQHLQRLIEDLRTLSLADAGELSLDRQRIAPRALLDRIVAVYAHQAEQQEILLETATIEAVPDLAIDLTRMTQVFSNLVSNALRYTPAHGSITLSAQPQGTGVALSVRDTGAGIMPDALPRIFDRFYRADIARAQSQGGSGLGLAIARALVEAHGGSISVTSQLGAGATFTIWLPAAS